MLFQLADNDLESFLRQDNLELIQSPGIREPNLNTWVYFDHRNFNSGNNDDPIITDPLPLVYEWDGSDVPPNSPKPTGSQYLHYEHSIQKMVINQTLEGEQDGDSPETLQAFIEVALADCIQRYQQQQQQTEQGSSTTVEGSGNIFTSYDAPMEFVLIMASHGSGWLGFGGDENTRRRRHLRLRRKRRWLLQQESNEDIVLAIQNALGNIPNAPDKLDVIGFDACNMQAVETVDDYQAVSKYFLASESVEPGHGWAYNELSNVDTALDLALNLYQSYLDSLHGYTQQKTPKTLAIVDTSSYPAFLQAWNGLSVILSTLLTDPTTNNDPDLYALLSRARFSAISFGTVLDDSGTPHPSAVDVGSFLDVFFNQCDPIPGHPSNLRTILMLANTTYHDMFIATGVGEGTVPATGMHIAWPVREEYERYQSIYDAVLLDETADNINHNVAVDASEWLQFLRTYYGYNAGSGSGATTTASRSSESGTYTSVCQLGTGNGDESATDADAAADAGQLLINPSVSGITANGGHEIVTGVARGTHTILTEFGVNLTPLLSERRQRERRQLWQHDSFVRKVQITDPLPTLDLWTDSNHPSLGESTLSLDFQPRKNKRRRLAGNGDYLIYYGGDIAGSYVQSSIYRAFWDRSFFVLTQSETGRIEDIYVMDLGSGSKQIPVIYIPRNNAGNGTVTSDQIGALRFSSLQEATTSLNGEWAYLSFSTQTATASSNPAEFSLSLFTSGTSSSSSSSNGHDGTTFRETPPSAGGQIVPLVYVDGSLDGTAYNMLVGGFQSSILDWNDASPLLVQQMDATTYLGGFGVTDMYIDIVAEADTGGGTILDFDYFIIGPNNVVEPEGQVFASGGVRSMSCHPIPMVVTTTIVLFTGLMGIVGLDL